MTSRHDVEVTLAALGIEEEREKDAMRRFYARERAQDRASNIRLLKVLALTLLKIVAVGIALYIIISGMFAL